MKKNNLLRSMSYKMLILTLSLSSLAILAKFIYSKKIRKLSYNLILGTSFVVFFLTASGSLLAIVLKPKSNIIQHDSLIIEKKKKIK